MNKLFYRFVLLVTSALFLVAAGTGNGDGGFDMRRMYKLLCKYAHEAYLICYEFPKEGLKKERCQFASEYMAEEVAKFFISKYHDAAGVETAKLLKKLTRPACLLGCLDGASGKAPMKYSEWEEMCRDSYLKTIKQAR